MAKYVISKPFTTRVTVGGAQGLSSKTFNAGETIDGQMLDGSISVRIAPHSAVNEGAPSNMSYQEFVNIPMEYIDVNSVKQSEMKLSNPQYQQTQEDLNRATNSKYLTMATGVGALAACTYVFYKVGKLPDSIPHERAYVLGACSVGVVSFLVAVGSAWGGGLRGKAEVIATAGMSAGLGGSLGYAITRVAFKQSPKNSLIVAGGLVTAGLAYWWFSMSAENRNKIISEIKEPKQTALIKPPVPVSIDKEVLFGNARPRQVGGGIYNPNLNTAALQAEESARRKPYEDQITQMGLYDEFVEWVRLNREPNRP
jgi:hypothetical protein